MTNTSPKKAKKMGDAAIDQILSWKSLPTCYRKFTSFLPDFYADLPWDNSISISIDHVLATRDRDLEEIKKRFKFDMKRELKLALKVQSCKDRP